MTNTGPSDHSTGQAAPRFRDRPFAMHAAAAAAAALLGAAWWAFHAWRPATFILTPHGRMAPLAPVYAFADPHPSRYVLFAVAALIVLALLLRPLGRIGSVGALIALPLLTACFWFAVHAAREGTLPGRELLTYPGEDVIFDVPRVDSVTGFLREYTDRQPELSLHGRTKPPGFALMHYALMTMFGDHVLVIGSLLTLLASLVAVPAYVLGRNVRGRHEDGVACALLVAVSPAGAAFGALSLDAIFAVVAASAIALAQSAAERSSRLRAAGLGLLLALGMMLSYATFLVGLLCGCLLAFRLYRQPLLCATRLGIVALAFLLPLAALAVWPGFDAWACFINARVLNEALMTGVIGRSLEGFGVWIYASIGNLLAFLIYLGPAIAGCLGLLTVHCATASQRSLAFAFVATLLVAGFGGLFLMETERILLFLVPPAAALAILPAAARPRALLLYTGAQAIAMEILVRTLW